MIDRRSFCAGLGAAALLLPAGAAAQGSTDFTMWHSPGCGCCLEWARRIQAAFGRPLRIVETRDIAAVKRAHRLPEDLWSCHTAIVGGVVVEGHVPPADIRRMMATNRRGRLAVPGMPAGSPGMDVGHDHREPFTVYAVAADGRRTVFARHGGR